MNISKSRALSLALFCFLFLGGLVDAYAQHAWVGRYISLKNVRLHNRYVRHRSYLGELTFLRNDNDRKDASFIVRKGLWGNGTISLESQNFPGYYLRHQGFRIKLQKFNYASQFRKDASFFVRNGLKRRGSYSFEAASRRGYYLRTCRYRMWIDNNRRSRRACPRLWFRAGASFWVMDSWYGKQAKKARIAQNWVNKVRKTWMRYPRVSQTDPYWWPMNQRGRLPKGAMYAGQEKGKLQAVCRVLFKNGFHPGKVMHKYCFIGWGGKEHRFSRYEVLMMPKRPVKRILWLGVIGPAKRRLCPFGACPGLAVKFKQSPNGSFKPSVGYPKMSKPYTLPSKHYLVKQRMFKGGNEYMDVYSSHSRRWNYQLAHQGICRAKYFPGGRIGRMFTKHKGIHIGRLRGDRCHFGYFGKEIVWKHEFDVLQVF